MARQSGRRQRGSGFPSPKAHHPFRHCPSPAFCVPGRKMFRSRPATAFPRMPFHKTTENCRQADARHFCPRLFAVSVHPPMMPAGHKGPWTLRYKNGLIRAQSGAPEYRSPREGEGTCPAKASGAVGQVIFFSVWSKRLAMPGRSRRLEGKIASRCVRTVAPFSFLPGSPLMNRIPDWFRVFSFFASGCRSMQRLGNMAAMRDRINVLCGAVSALAAPGSLHFAELSAIIHARGGVFPCSPRVS